MRENFITAFLPARPLPGKIAWELKKLLGQKKTEKPALYLLLRYRMAGLDIPDLLLWAMANQEVSRPFLGHFLNQYRELAKGGAEH